MHRQLAAKTAPASSPRARFALKLHVRKPKILPKIVRLRLFFAHLFGHREQQNASPIDGQDGTGEQSARSFCGQITRAETENIAKNCKA